MLKEHLQRQRAKGAQSIMNKICIHECIAICCRLYGLLMQSAPLLCDVQYVRFGHWCPCKGSYCGYRSEPQRTDRTLSVKSSPDDSQPKIGDRDRMVQSLKGEDARRQQLYTKTSCLKTACM